MNIRIPIASLIVISLLVGAGFISKTRGRENPDVEVAGGAVYDAGNVPVSHPLVHAFRLNNPHAFAVGLSIVTTGCDCTTAKASASAIPPHGAADVILNVKLEDTNDVSSGVCIATTHGGQKVETWLLLTGHVNRGAARASKNR